jgi:hypothetical protein
MNLMVRLSDDDLRVLVNELDYRLTQPGFYPKATMEKLVQEAFERGMQHFRRFAGRRRAMLKFLAAQKAATAA